MIHGFSSDAIDTVKPYSTLSLIASALPSGLAGCESYEDFQIFDRGSDCLVSGHQVENADRLGWR